MAKIITDENKINDFLNSRYVEAVFPSKDRAKEILKQDKELVFYLGIDPTSPSLHIGHSIPLLLLKQLGKLGHKIILLIGDFTARIGDPTDKEAARVALTEEEVKGNMKTYIEQVKKILGDIHFEIKYNSKWFGKMTFEDVIKLTSHATVQQMIARDMFQERIKKEKPIFVHEFLYPLMQGYDSVAMQVDGEVGGNDQTFNMLVGRDLEKEYLGKDKLVFATRLLVDATSGKKISKTEGEFIAVNDSAEDIFGKVMKSVPDEMIKIVFELATEVSLDEIEKIQIGAGENPKNFKEELGYELVRMYYGEKAAQKAKDDFDKTHSEKIFPVEAPEIENKGTILQTSVMSGIISSMSVGKELIRQGAIDINGKTVKRWDEETKPGDEIKVGTHIFRKVK